MSDDQRQCPGCGQWRDRATFRRNGYCAEQCNANTPVDCVCPPTYRDCRCGAKKP